MNDFILLLQSHPYAVVGQQHQGWVGFIQNYLLKSLNCVWFDRAAEDDKRKAADVLKAHIMNPANAGTPALIFPEGTCVNNEYVVQVSKAGIKEHQRGACIHAHSLPSPPLLQCKAALTFTTLSPSTSRPAPPRAV